MPKVATRPNRFVTLDRPLCQAIYRDSTRTLFDIERIGDFERFHFPMLAGNTVQRSDFVADGLFHIECLVDDIMTYRLVPLYAPSDGEDASTPVNKRLWRHHFSHLGILTACALLLSPHYRFSPRVSAFRDALSKAGILFLQSDLLAEEPQDKWAYTIQPKAGQFEQLINGIQAFCGTAAFRKTIAEGQREALRCFTTHQDEFAELFNRGKRILVLRLDFGYETAIHHAPDYPALVEDFNRLLANRRTNRTFNGELGFLARPAYHSDKGYQWNTIFCFDGIQRAGIDHVQLSQEIGESWIQLNPFRSSPRSFHAFNFLQQLGQGPRPEVDVQGFGPLLDTDIARQNDFKTCFLAHFCRSGEFISLNQPEPYAKAHLIRGRLSAP